MIERDSRLHGNEKYAAVAELVDALDSKSSKGNLVTVRVRSAVQKYIKIINLA